MEGSPNDIRGNGHRRTRIDDHWQRKTGGGIGEKKNIISLAVADFL